MTDSAIRIWNMPREEDLGLRSLMNGAGLSIKFLPNASIFAIEHRDAQRVVLVNQVLSSPVGGGIARILIRTGGAEPNVIQAVGARAKVSFGLSGTCAVWDGAAAGVRHRVTLVIQPGEAAWLWQVEVTNRRDAALSLDAVLVQDLGLAGRAFLMNNEAYASQYIDHHCARHPRYGPVVMCRQNLAQKRRHPWVAQGCLGGAAGFATDGMQLFGPRHRDADELELPFGKSLPSCRLQHELACAAIQSQPASLAPGASAVWRFFALYEAHHGDPSSDADLAKIDAISWLEPQETAVPLSSPVRSVVQDARSARIVAPPAQWAHERYPARFLEEQADQRLLSFFTPDGRNNRHVVLADKERAVTRRHGALLRSGSSMLPDESTLCATLWMHGAFGAQLTIGNTSLHKLFSVSRDPYNIMRSSALRVMFDREGQWRVLTVPWAFEMGLSDSLWIYPVHDAVITVRAIASADDPAMQWRITVEGAPLRILVFAHVAMGERELEDRGAIELDPVSKRCTFRPDPNGPWAKRYPSAVYHLVTSTPDVVEAIGGDELLYADGQPRHGPYIAIRTSPLGELRFAVVGSMTSPEAAARLAAKYEQPIAEADLQPSIERFWRKVTRGVRIGCRGRGEAAGSRVAAADSIKEAVAVNALLPWLAHDAMIHLTVPRGLEQYTGAAWGTRDVCQGPVEFLLSLEHDEPVKAILRTVFAQQYARRGDWPQWFMLEPYSAIQDRTSHGDVIVWPLKALNDYLEATNDLAFLDEPVPWRADETLDLTVHADSVASHVEKLIATTGERFIPGTHLIRYGDGDWNDSLQPANAAMRDWMVSSWTVALLFQQVKRYAEVLHRAGRESGAAQLSRLAEAMSGDFNRFLIRDGTVAGYGLFAPGSVRPELLLHPSDSRTGLRYSLLPMTRSIIAGLFTSEQAHHHLRLIREHLLFPDGARLIDRPVAYRGGLERVFRRAESSAFFGREIGLMYVHAHLRYAEAMAALGEADALWEALRLASPIAVTDRLAHALPRQRNAYFSSSDAAFPDRYEAASDWSRVKDGTVPVEGGWRVYSSGPGLYVSALIRQAFGARRQWGERVREPLLPADLRDLVLEWDLSARSP